MAIQRAESVLRTKIGVDYLFCPLMISMVFRMKVLVVLIEGPNLNILRASAMEAQTVSAFLMLSES